MKNKETVVLIIEPNFKVAFNLENDQRLKSFRQE